MIVIGGEDSLPGIPKPIPSPENTTTTTTNTVPASDSQPSDPPDVPTRETDPDSSAVEWKRQDKTLTWEKTLPQVNLLESAGNGSEDCQTQ